MATGSTFKAAVTTFQSSNDGFNVICTVPANADAAQPTPRPIRPAQPVQQLVVLDSSFNPPTTAHMQMAVDGVRSAIGRLSREEEHVTDAVRLLLLLAVKNADKAPEPAPFEQRLAMMYAFGLDVQQALGRGDIDALQREVAVDIGLTTQPYFNDKSLAIAESGFYSAQAEGRDDPLSMSETLREEIGDVRARFAFASYLEMADLSPEEERLSETQPMAKATSSDPTAVRQRSRDTGPSKASPEGEVADHHQGPEQIILAGFDTLIRIFNPKYYGSNKSDDMAAALTPFFKQARLRIRVRPDPKWGSREKQLAYVKDLTEDGGLERIGGSKDWAERIEVVTASDGIEGVSSTAARGAAGRKDWKALREIVPQSVAELVERESLYASS